MRRATLLIAVVLIAQACSGAELKNGTAGGFHRVKASAVSSTDQSIWAFAASPIAPETSEIWHTDRSGLRRTVHVATNPPIERFEDVIAVAGDGDIYVVGWAEGRMQLVKIAQSGVSQSMRPLGIRSGRLLGLLPAQERAVLLFGQNDRGAFAAKIDESGLWLWTIEIDEHPRAAAFVDASLTVDGSCFLTARVWAPAEFGFDATGDRTLLIKVDSRGRIVRSRTGSQARLELSSSRHQ